MISFVKKEFSFQQQPRNEGEIMGNNKSIPKNSLGNLAYCNAGKWHEI